MIEGALRIGKSYIAEEFARNEYESYILIDFSKAPSRVKGWFDEYLEDVDTLLQNIQLHYKKQLTPRRSLIILDEVQKCPRAREAVKALVADHRFDYLETGSLISIKKNVENIVIPSEKDGIDMYPMDFEEFLWAMGNEVLMPYIRSCFEKRRPMGDFHRVALHYFRQYLIVGGMPQAVAEYASSRDFTRVDAVKRQILRLYKNDINISPIEVKSGTNYTLTSINKCIKKFGQYLGTPYVLHTKDIDLKDGLVYLPLYMTPLL